MKVKLKEIRKLKDIAIQTSFIGLLPAVIFFCLKNYLFVVLGHTLNGGVQLWRK